MNGYDYHTGQLLLESFGEIGQDLKQCEKGSIKELFSRLQNSCIKILRHDKTVLAKIHLSIESAFPPKQTYTVCNKHDMVEGYFTPNMFSWRAKYDVFDTDAKKVFCVKFKALLPKMLFEVNGTELARLYRNWKKLLKPTYILTIKDTSNITEPLRLLMLSCAICTLDMPYGWSEFI